MKIIKQGVGLCIAAAFLLFAANAQQPGHGTLRGKVVDVQGALIRGANVKIIGTDGSERTAQTNQDGEFSVNNLAAGKYSVAVSAQGFAPYENAEATVVAGKTLALDIALSITVSEKVTVSGDAPINTSPEANASAVVIKDN